jgi:predicted transcriptional regulator
MTIILLVLGIPDFHLADSQIDQQRFDAAVEKLKEKQQQLAVVAEEIVDDVAETVDDVQDNIEIVTEKALPQATAQVAEEVSVTPESVTQPLSRAAVAASEYQRNCGERIRFSTGESHRP